MNLLLFAHAGECDGEGQSLLVFGILKLIHSITIITVLMILISFTISTLLREKKVTWCQTHKGHYNLLHLTLLLDL